MTWNRWKKQWFHARCSTCSGNVALAWPPPSQIGSLYGSRSQFVGPSFPQTNLPHPTNLYRENATPLKLTRDLGLPRKEYLRRGFRHNQTFLANLGPSCGTNKAMKHMNHTKHTSSPSDSSVSHCSEGALGVLAAQL